MAATVAVGVINDEAGRVEPVAEFVARRPTPDLRPLVAGYVGYRQAGLPAGEHRGLPSPDLTIIITLDDPLVLRAHPDPRAPAAQYDTLIGGLHTEPAIIAHPGRQSGIQVALSPLGARALLGQPAGELASADVAAQDIWGAFAIEVRERMLAAPTWTRRFAILEAMLVRRITGARVAGPAPEVARAWSRLLRSGGAVTVRDLAAEVGWSSRHLSQRFATEIGLSPKVAARVIRFDRVRRMLGAGHPIAAAAARCGYYDQAHLNRDFAAFAGLSPTRWLTAERHHIADAADNTPVADADQFRNVQATRRAGLKDSPHDDIDNTTTPGLAHAEGR